MKQYKIIKADDLERAQEAIDAYAAAGWVVKTMSPDVDNIGYFVLLEADA
jgi:hypothetical protein